jgi:two-component system, cell cycle response regulator
MRILIAEDDVTSRNIIQAVLKKGGHEVVTTVNGAEAWIELQKPDAPKLAILDWMMPEMDGLEVVCLVRANQVPQPPYIIMLTAKGEKADIIAGLDAGANDYLAKPFDVTELQARIRVGQRMVELQETIVHQSTHDPLTGVLNRRGILNALETEVSRAKRTSASLSVGMCDLDHFKQVNDTHGHLVGDDVLCGAVQSLQGGLRNYDLIGRYGGEEFLVVAPGSAGTSEENLYHRLCAAVAENPMATRGGGIAVTVSIGVATAKGDSTADAVLAVADTALYRAKDEGRNRVIYATNP